MLCAYSYKTSEAGYAASGGISWRHETWNILGINAAVAFYYYSRVCPKQCLWKRKTRSWFRHKTTRKRVMTAIMLKCSLAFRYFDSRLEHHVFHTVEQLLYFYLPYHHQCFYNIVCISHLSVWNPTESTLKYFRVFGKMNMFIDVKSCRAYVQCTCTSAQHGL